MIDNYPHFFAPVFRYQAGSGCSPFLSNGACYPVMPLPSVPFSRMESVGVSIKNVPDGFGRSVSEQLLKQGLYGIVKERKQVGTVGLAYLFILVMILGTTGAAVALLAAAWKIWKRARFKILAIIPLFLTAPCAVVTVYLLAIVWREPPWGFHF